MKSLGSVKREYINGIFLLNTPHRKKAVGFSFPNRVAPKHDGAFSLEFIGFSKTKPTGQRTVSSQEHRVEFGAFFRFFSPPRPRQRQQVGIISS